MGFFSSVALLDSTVLTVLSDGFVTLHFQTGELDLTVPFTFENPVMREDYQPGLPQSIVNPVTNLLLFVKLNGTAQFPGIVQLSRNNAGAPANLPTSIGDTATVNGIYYDIHRVDVDREGGACLHLKRKT